MCFQELLQWLYYVLDSAEKTLEEARKMEVSRVISKRGEPVPILWYLVNTTPCF
jgi:hypothetical protein